MITIDKNIPTPGKARRVGAPKKYPFSEMEVGDSFEYPIKSVAFAASANGIKFGKKFTVRKTENGYRCWRIA